MPRSGFTLAEVALALVIMGALTAIGIPGFREFVLRADVRSARTMVMSRLGETRAVAVQRGCTATLHINAATTEVWVTTCSPSGAGVDTVGTVTNLGRSTGVSMTSTGATLMVTPQGVGMAPDWINLTFIRGGHTADLAISPVGRATW